MINKLKFSQSIIFIFFISSPYAFTQNKTSFNLIVGLNKSIGRNILAYHDFPEIRGEAVYYSREKFKYPFNSIKINYSYNPSKNWGFGFQSGVYLYYSQYYGVTISNAISVPVEATVHHKILNVDHSPVGIKLSYGLNFSNKGDYAMDYKSGHLFSGSFYYTLHNGNAIHLGIENQVYNVDYFHKRVFGDGENFSYKISRLSLFLNYSIDFYYY